MNEIDDNIRSLLSKVLFINSGIIALFVLYIIYYHILFKNGSGSISFFYEGYLFLVASAITKNSNWGYRKAKFHLYFVMIILGIVISMLLIGLVLFKTELYLKSIPYILAGGIVFILNLTTILKISKLDFKNAGEKYLGLNNFPKTSLYILCMYIALIILGIYFIARPFFPNI